MTQRKTATPKNEPIVLSGSVFLDGILAEDNPRARMPAKLEVGDIRLNNVNKKGERPRFGQTVTFSGFIVANVWNGKKFRRLLLRKLGGVESTYVGPAARRERATALIRHLETLVRRQAFWFAQDSGYEVSRHAPAIAATSAPQAVSPSPPAMPTPEAVAVSVTVKVEVESAGETVVHTTTQAQHFAARQRRRRKVVVDENQLPLFPDKT